MKRFRRIATWLHGPAAFASLLSVPAAAETLSGPAKVIDGDSLEVAGSRVRLFGIDAPEATQTCDRVGEAWACGQASAEQLQGLIGTDTIVCQGSEKDVFGRLLAICRIAGVDLNRAMVAGGWATAFRRYSDDYAARLRPSPQVTGGHGPGTE